MWPFTKSRLARLECGSKTSSSVIKLIDLLLHQNIIIWHNHLLYNLTLDWDNEFRLCAQKEPDNYVIAGGALWHIPAVSQFHAQRFDVKSGWYLSSSEIWIKRWAVLDHCIYQCLKCLLSPRTNFVNGRINCSLYFDSILKLLLRTMACRNSS